ncbi:Protein SIEVE ELEMENT OCCLUSION C [Vitis vinifera]|uniref:Protein SIEVE ELEMENT OCCLUSION C n=1 Tax=Vitis vinifera TaxID=29760 RepID=A0A438GK91_VITVI|nr:Protein SIEVE ELEMENT OCCLUSION C [Vitis vinifera]
MVMSIHVPSQPHVFFCVLLTITSAMNVPETDNVLPHSSSPLEQDILIKNILLTHDPNGCFLDSELLLCAMENIMCHTTSEIRVPGLYFDAMARKIVRDIEVVGSQEPLGLIIHKISREILCKCSVEGDSHTRTMVLFDMLRNYRWDAKVVLVLAAFATCYGQLWLLMQPCPVNPLAISIAMLKQLPSNFSALRPRFKALNLLAKAMADVAKCIIKFESLPIKDVKLDKETMTVTKSQIYLSAYWVIKSTLTCSSQIRDLTAMKLEQIIHRSNLACYKPLMFSEFHFRHSSSITVAAWELLSLVYKLGRIYSQLRWQVDVCHQQIETKLHQKLLDLSEETQVDNQEVLHMLFALRDDTPLIDCSSQRRLLGVSELKNKVVICMVSKPEPLPIEELLFLVQQTYDHPHHNKLERSYEIVWVPIPSSDTWTEAEERSFDFLCYSLPWYSVRQPWLLCSEVVTFIKQKWNFKDEPIMVVLDSQGEVTNSNAIDMALIWGDRAYPFSASVEKKLWEEEKWNLQFMIDEIDSLLTKLVHEGRNLCIYGSQNLHWIREFNSKMKEITNAGLQLEMAYVGKRNPSEHERNILATIDLEKLSGSLSFTKIHLFWRRLESMRRSVLRLGKTANTDHILGEVAALLDMDDENGQGWAVMGSGSSMEILGLVGAVKSAVEPPALPGHRCQSRVRPFAEGLIDETEVCNECKRPMEKFVLYKCDTRE